MSVRLSIIIVNWRSLAYLQQCLSEVRRCTRLTDYEVIVIDAGSYDGCAEALAESWPDVHVIQSEVNEGFAASNNRAARTATGELLLFLNPDTECRDRAIDQMVEVFSSRSDVGVVGARLLNSDGTLQTSCVQAIPSVLNQALNSNVLRRLWPGSRLWATDALSRSGSAALNVEAVSGACLMIRRATFERLAGFSELFFMYVEDVDICDRVRQLGMQVAYMPAAEVVHHGGSSSEKAVSSFAAQMLPQAMWLFFWHRRGPLVALTYRGALTAVACARLLCLGVAWIDASRRREVSASAAKWRAVLAWCVMGSAIVRQHYTDPAYRTRCALEAQRAQG